MKTLWIDACVRAESRTRELAEEVLACIGGDVEHLALSGLALPVLDAAALEQRGRDTREDAFFAPVYDYARQFAAANQIVIAAPYWDLSFPACLKKYLETISVAGLTFRYSPAGIPMGLCRATRLFYVTTAGGLLCEAFGYDYVKALATGLFGIPECRLFKAENLDIVGNDVQAILRDAKQIVRNAFA